MPYRIRSARGVDEKMAAALVADARPVAASYPNAAFVQRTMAEIEYDAKNNAEAEAAADRALALDPKLVVALLYTGRVLAPRAPASMPADDWNAWRTWLLTAHHAAPNLRMPPVPIYDS